MGFWQGVGNIVNGINNSFISGASTLLTDIGDALGIGSARRQREFESAEAEKQRAWEKEMSDTAHQREVADLEAAGLNPILSTGLGGAATPTGASARGVASNSNVGDLGVFLNGTANLVNSFKNSSAKKSNGNSGAVREAVSTAVSLLKLLK